MALDFADFPIVYQVGGIAALPTHINIETGSAVQVLVCVVNAGHRDERVRAVIRGPGGVVRDSAFLGAEQSPFDVIHPDGFEIWGPDLDAGLYWFQVCVTALTLLPTVDIRVVEEIDGETVFTPVATCYPGDFAITHQRLRVLGGVEVPGLATGDRLG